MAGIESEWPESYGDRSKSPMSATVEDSSSSKSKSPLSATEEDSSSSKSKSPLSSTDESMLSSKAVNIDGGVEEDSDEDYDDDIASDADTDDMIEYLFGNDPRQALSEDEFYDPGRRNMTAEEMSAYAKQVRDSEGFDVDPAPDGVRPYGNIIPYPDIDDFCRELTDFAIQRNNSDENGKLKLTRIIKWNHELAGPMNYYITFEAEDVDTGEVETYQAKVALRIPEEETYVPIFRVKPRPASPTEGSR